MIEADGGESTVVRADVTDPAQCEAIVRTAKDAFGRVDILVNNVGIAGAKGTAVEADLAEWTQGLLVNVTSMMLMAKHAVPAMVEECSRWWDGPAGVAAVIPKLTDQNPFQPEMTPISEQAERVTGSGQ